MIPKNLYQTYKSYNLPDKIKQCINLIVKTNFDFNYTFMNDEECYEFIKANFDEEFLKMYKNLPLGVMRADVWRVAIIYINGGIYCDCDVICYNNLTSLIKDQELVLFEEKNGSTSNFFFAAKPKHPALKKVLDLMVKEQKRAFDTNTPGLLVQDFGMALFHDILSKESNRKILSYQDSNKWMLHLCLNSWKKSEENYKMNSTSTKPVIFFTTFNENGYNVYGKTWIDSFIENIASQRSNISAIVYADNIPNLSINHPQIKVVDYKTTFPDHEIWKQKFLAKSNLSDRVKLFTVRFSYKGFCIQYVLKTVKQGYAIWTDGDVVFKKHDFANFPSMFFEKNEVLACQVEDSNHVESGIMIFDVENLKIQEFAECYSKNYSLDQILTSYGEPYDGFVARRSLDNSKILYYDLNELSGNRGIQSDPNETFLHPELRSRFSHNIGITGKRSYEHWNKVRKKDSIFLLLEDSNMPLTAVDEKIWKLKAKRLKV